MSSPEPPRAADGTSRAAGASQAVPSPLPTPAARPPQPAAAEPPPVTAAHAENLAKDTQEYLRAFIELADQKAAFVFTGASAVLAYLYSKDAQARWLVPTHTWGFAAVVAFVAMLCMMLTVVLAIAVVMPRRTGKGRNAFYWDAIAAHGSADAYAAASNALAESDIVRERQRLCYDLARVCRAKYRYLNAALRTAAIAAIATLVYLLIYAGSVPVRPPESRVVPAVHGTRPMPDRQPEHFKIDPVQGPPTAPTSGSQTQTAPTRPAGAAVAGSTQARPPGLTRP